MSWPTEHEPPVACIGFNPRRLPDIMRAVDNDFVEWGETSMFAGSTTAVFRWANCTWEMNEWFERVTSIRLIEAPNPS